MDVDRLLDELTPEELDWWIAYRELEPDPIDRIAEILKLGFTTLCRCWGGKVTPDDFEIRPTAKEGEPTVGPRQARQMIEAITGDIDGHGNR